MNWKKLLAALIAVCLAVSCLCANVFADDMDGTNGPPQEITDGNGDGSGGTSGGNNQGAVPPPANGGTGETRPQEPITTNTDPDPDSSIGGGINETPDDHGEIAQAKSEGKWGEEYTTCEKCGKHDWWKLSDGTFVCKNCGFNTTGVKETSNVEVWEGGTDLVVLNAQVETKDTQSGNVGSVAFEITGKAKIEESTGSQSGKDTLSVSISSVGGVDVAGNAEQSAGQTITGTVSVSDIKNLIQVKDSKESQFIRINLEETLSLNPVQAAADKRELRYLNSVLAYQIANAQKEHQYIASVQQQQLAAVQREDAYAEMVLAAAAKLQQEADQREAAYLQSVRAAQVAAQKQVNVPLSSGGTSQNKKQITVK